MLDSKKKRHRADELVLFAHFFLTYVKSKGSFKDFQFFHDFNDMLQVVNKRSINHLLIIMPRGTSTRTR